MNTHGIRVEGVDLGQVVQIAKGFADEASAREAHRARWAGFLAGSVVTLLLAVAVAGLCSAAGALRVGLPAGGGTTAAPPLVYPGPTGVPAGGPAAPLPPAPPPRDEPR